MSDKRVTVSFLKWLMNQMKSYFVAKGAQKLIPGAKINGVLFTGYNDIDVPVSVQHDITVIPGHAIGIFFDNSYEAGWILRNNGIYFSDGTNEIPIIKIEKDSNTGAFTVSSKISDNGGSSSKTIEFVTGS